MSDNAPVPDFVMAVVPVILAEMVAVPLERFTSIGESVTANDVVVKLALLIVDAPVMAKDLKPKETLLTFRLSVPAFKAMALLAPKALDESSLTTPLEIETFPVYPAFKPESTRVPAPEGFESDALPESALEIVVAPVLLAVIGVSLITPPLIAPEPLRVRPLKV